MTTPAGEQAQPGPVFPVDPGNPLLAPGDAALATAFVDTAAGQRLAVTVRTSSATVTVFLDRENARTWGRTITGAGDAMSGLILAGAPLTGSPGLGG